MKSSKVFWGIFFILAAVYVVISKFGILPDIGVFSILLTVFLIWVFVEGVRNFNFYEMLFSVAFICIVYDEQLGITALTPWTVLGAALLGSIGLTMIFSGVKKKRKIATGQSCSQSYVGSGSEQCTGEQIRCENNFGSAIRYINSDNFKNAVVENNFGVLSVYFDNAIVQSESAFVNVENNFGETNLYIPKEWKVQNNLDRSFDAINEIGSSIGTSNTLLYINGSANFGAINIHYI